MKDKIAAANKLISLVNEKYIKPVAMVSFGKDSMVMLALIRAAGFKWPVVFHREPFFPEKYEFANRVIRDWDLEVHDYPPRSTALIKRNGEMEVVNYYSLGLNSLTSLPTGIVEPNYDKCGQRFLCGLKDLLLKPLGTFNWPWDVALIGHKNSDTDPIRGPMPLHVDVKQQPNCPDLLFPLRTWTDNDVWEYAETHDVPIHTERYERNGHWREKDDKTFNPDYFPVCMRCIDRDQPKTVLCPKLGLELNNVSSQIRYVEEAEVDYCGETNAV